MSESSKKKQFIHKGSVCEDNFYPDGPKTIAEARKIGRQPCPYFSKCKSGLLKKGLLKEGYQCAMLLGAQIARSALNENQNVATEMADFRREMVTELKQTARKGIIWSPDRKTFEIIADTEEGIKKMEEFANMVIEGIRPRKT